MKRFHVHLHVADLEKSIGFYSALFAAQPAEDGRRGQQVRSGGLIGHARVPGDGFALAAENETRQPKGCR